MGVSMYRHNERQLPGSRRQAIPANFEWQHGADPARTGAEPHYPIGWGCGTRSKRDTSPIFSATMMDGSGNGRPAVKT